MFLDQNDEGRIKQLLVVALRPLSERIAKLEELQVEAARGGVEGHTSVPVTPLSQGIPDEPPEPGTMLGGAGVESGPLAASLPDPHPGANDVVCFRCRGSKIEPYPVSGGQGYDEPVRPCKECQK